MLDHNKSKEDLVAVLHVWEGGEHITASGSKQIRMYCSLAFVSGISMPYVAYKIEEISADFRHQLKNKIVELNNTIIADSKTTYMEFTSEDPNAWTKQKQPQACEWGGNHETRAKSRCDRLFEVGAKITKQLKLNSVLELLYELRQQINHLHIVTNIDNLPWDMLCVKPANKQHPRLFLADLYGIGLSNSLVHMSEAKSTLANDIHKLQQQDETLPLLLHICSDYKHHPSLTSFPDIENILDNSNSIFSENIEFQTLIANDPISVSEQVLLKTNRLGLIVLSGHYSTDGYICSEQGNEEAYLTSNDIEYTNSELFKRNPVVILGGCNSADSSTKKYRGALGEKSMADAFIKTGAGACLVTDEAIEYDDYKVILEMLVKKMCKNISVGLALHQVRKQLSDTGHNDRLKFACYRMHIQGDPTTRIL